MIEVIKGTIVIIGFVLVMMLVTEYVNVLTSGARRGALVPKQAAPALGF